MADAQKCKHTLCTCTVAKGQKYCSPTCEGSAESSTISCDCPHTNCKGHVANP
jgi:hypothetical protein